MKKIIGSIILGFTILSSYADISIPVVVNVLPVCTNTITDMEFGTIKLNSGTDFYAENTITTLCNYGTKVTVLLDDGLYNSGEQRRMKHETRENFISYNIYEDTNYTIPINQINYIQENEIEVKKLYGKLILNQNVPIGQYSDTISVEFIYE